MKAHKTTIEGVTLVFENGSLTIIASEGMTSKQLAKIKARNSEAIAAFVELHTDLALNGAKLTFRGENVGSNDIDSIKAVMTFLGVNPRYQMIKRGGLHVLAAVMDTYRFIVGNPARSFRNHVLQLNY